MNLASGLPYLFEVFPAGVSPQNIYTSNAYENMNSSGLLIKFDTKSHLINDLKHKAKTRAYQKIGKSCMHFVKSSYVQKEINMSEGLMNIDLP